MAVTFGVLGPVVAERSGRRLELGTVRQRALLGVLALEARHVVPVGAGYSLDAPDEGVDALAFAAAAARAVRAEHDGNHVDALAAAGDGLARWRGPALVDERAQDLGRHARDQRTGGQGGLRGRPALEQRR